MAKSNDTTLYFLGGGALAAWYFRANIEAWLSTNFPSLANLFSTTTPAQTAAATAAASGYTPVQVATVAQIAATATTAAAMPPAPTAAAMPAAPAAAASPYGSTSLNAAGFNGTAYGLVQNASGQWVEPMSQ